MSAFCCNQGLRAVNDSALEIDRAIDHGASDAAGEALVRRGRCAAASIGVDAGTDRHSGIARFGVARLAAADTSSSGPAVDRITIRLRPGDRLAIRHRAAERRMKDSAYIAALVRGHVAANPPLATHELAAFKAAVSVLAGFGRLLARTAREAAQTGVLTRDLQQDLGRTRALVADVERRMHEFAQAALVSWESRVD